MNAEGIRKIFEEVRKGRLASDEAVQRLRHLPFEDLGFAKVDHHRALRAGMPEVILGEGKTPAQVAQIFSRLAKHGGNILATRTNPQQFAAVKKKAPKAEYRELARAVVLRRERKKYGKGIIAVVSAGTSDIPVAEEAVVTAELMGNDVERLYDVGVAGIHRLLANRGALTRARVVVVGGRSDWRSGDRCANKRWLRSGLQRIGGTFRNDELVRLERKRCKYR